MFCKGAPTVIKLSNVGDATVASIVTDANGGICEGMMITIQPLIDVATRNPKGMSVMVKSDSGSGIVSHWLNLTAPLAPLAPLAAQPPKKRSREDMMTGREFLERIEKKVGIDALQAYYATDEFKIKVQEAVAEKVKELEPEIRKRIQ